MRKFIEVSRCFWPDSSKSTENFVFRSINAAKWVFRTIYDATLGLEGYFTDVGRSQRTLLHEDADFINLKIMIHITQNIMIHSLSESLFCEFCYHLILKIAQNYIFFYIQKNNVTDIIGCDVLLIFLYKNHISIQHRESSCRCWRVFGPMIYLYLTTTAHKASTPIKSPIFGQ